MLEELSEIGKIISICHIGAIFSLVIPPSLAAILTNLFNIWREERKAKNFTKSVLKSLRAELQTLLNVYEPMMKEAFDYEGDFSTWRFGAKQDFFSIYHSNGAFIGQIEDDDLKGEIIKTYINAKKYLENWTDYGDELDKYDAEKNKLLQYINAVMLNSISEGDLDEFLKMESDITSFMQSQGITNIVIINNVKKAKELIGQMSYKLKYYIGELKKDFDELVPQMQKCIDGIDNYLK